MKSVIIFALMVYELIDDETISSIAKNLKDLVPNWASTISEKISKDAHWKVYTDIKCSEQIAVNIGRGTVKSQLHRRLFVKYAEVLLTPVYKEQKKRARAAKKISKWTTVN